MEDPREPDLAYVSDDDDDDDDDTDEDEVDVLIIDESEYYEATEEPQLMSEEPLLIQGEGPQQHEPPRSLLQQQHPLLYQQLQHKSSTLPKAEVEQEVQKHILRQKLKELLLQRIHAESQLVQHENPPSLGATNYYPIQQRQKEVSVFLIGDGARPQQQQQQQQQPQQQQQQQSVSIRLMEEDAGSLSRRRQQQHQQPEDHSRLHNMQANQVSGGAGQQLQEEQLQTRGQQLLSEYDRRRLEVAFGLLNLEQGERAAAARIATRDRSLPEGAGAMEEAGAGEEQMMMEASGTSSSSAAGFSATASPASLPASTTEQRGQFGQSPAYHQFWVRSLFAHLPVKVAYTIPMSQQSGSTLSVATTSLARRQRRLPPRARVAGPAA